MSGPSLVGVIRPPFLILTPVCVLLGVATAHWEGQPVDTLHAVLALFGALSAHISVNALNEYLDFRSGLDLQTRRTPFSGGSGTLVARPELAGGALLIGVVSLLATILVGLYFLAKIGWALLPIGLAGVLVIVAYTDWINRNRWLCLVAPGLGFGPLMVLGTYYVATGGLSLAAVAVSLIPFFLVNNLLLLNQFPDIEPDRGVGRDNFPIALGPATSARIYAFFAIAAYATLTAAAFVGWLPFSTLAALVTAALAWHAWRGAAHFGPESAGQPDFLRSNVIATLATPALISAALYLG